MQSESNESKPGLFKPSLTFETITFSCGETISVAEDEIVVFVGPNNAGKSAALRELEAWITQDSPGVVIHGATLRKSGSAYDLQKYLEANAQKQGDSLNMTYGGIGYSIHHSHVEQFNEPHNRYAIASFFSKRMTTESRLSDSNPAPAIELHEQPPHHPIHLLLMYPDLAKEISGKFNHAFGKDLTPFRAGGASFPLYVGKKPEITPGKDEFDKEFVDALKKTNVRLDRQGDGMRSFAAVLLHVLAAKSHSVQFLDEPEAFLHPPQARLLGKYIAEKRNHTTQLFISTHSTDILDGLIEAGSEKVRIVRLRREGDVNRVRELGQEEAKAIATDTLTRFSRVFEGIFFEHVVICESDADCMFYQSLLNLPEISGDRRPDVLFVHSAGKHRMGKLAKTLRSLDVPVSVIADIDLINNEGTFRGLVEKVGGDWPAIQKHWKVVSDAVVALRPPLNAATVKQMISAELEKVSGTQEFPRESEKAIKRIFDSVSPWSTIKQSGRNGLPSGGVTVHFDKLYNLCAEAGLWLVPVGEIEGFCRTVSPHGPGFVEKVLETRDIATDIELAEARDFVKKIWSSAQAATSEASPEVASLDNSA